MQTEDWVHLLSLVSEQYEVKVKIYNQLKTLDEGIHGQLRSHFYQYHVLPAFALYTKVTQEIACHMTITLASRR